MLQLLLQYRIYTVTRPAATIVNRTGKHFGKKQDRVPGKRAVASHHIMMIVGAVLTFGLHMPSGKFTVRQERMGLAGTSIALYAAAVLSDQSPAAVCLAVRKPEAHEG